MYVSTKIKRGHSKGETKILSYVTADGKAIMKEYPLLGCDTMYIGRISLVVTLLLAGYLHHFFNPEDGGSAFFKCLWTIRLQGITLQWRLPCIWSCLFFY
jgi:hypothetical protein